ncbi:free fatty acid receptor 4-like isoform X2 [Dendropsophus ebraccatus]|uniref:free fatty acid receptor 4-like isoform X2 n=1 Tax=Dendropsophus ebraccatus TaxID=150705 RepID=UPI003831C786
MGYMIVSCQDAENCTLSYFTFYSEFDKPLAVKVVETIFLTVVFTFSCFVNICAIVLLLRKKKMVTANCFVLNLFCADLLFISLIPLILVVRWSEVWILGDFFCHLIFYVICLSGCVILISLSAVSLERMICIMKVTQATACNRKVVAVGIVTIWGFSGITALPMCRFFNVVTQRVNNQLTKEIRERMISSTAYSEVHQYRVSQRDYRLFRTLFILMISFFVMWTPVCIIVLLLLLHNLTKNFSLSPTVFFWITVFTFCNSILNPILYNINLLKQKWWRVIFCGNPEDTVDTDTTNKKNDMTGPNGTSDIKEKP